MKSNLYFKIAVKFRILWLEQSNHSNGTYYYSVEHRWTKEWYAWVTHMNPLYTQTKNRIKSLQQLNIHVRETYMSAVRNNSITLSITTSMVPSYKVNKFFYYWLPQNANELYVSSKNGTHNTNACLLSFFILANYYLLHWPK